MCGIAGVFHYGDQQRADIGVLQRMARRMAHRGPDGDGFHVSGPCGLTHRRLSIIDLAGGKQPLSNEDGRVWVTFNGEIYNYKPLFGELQARGHQFRTRSDTETIVHAYEELGPRCVDRLQGMFAFAIWDENRRRLVIARDRVGIKPLYYHDDGKRIAFSSEIGPLLEVPGVRREADPEAARLFLAFGFVPAPRTGLAGVKKLEPGHVMVIQEGGTPTIERYWRRPLGGERADMEGAAAELDRRLKDTVASHLQADVPLGMLLSGGIDSSTILGHTARQVPSQVKTFSVFFGEGAYYDETPMARLSAQRNGSDHRELLCTPDVFVSEIPHFIRHMEEPVIEAAAIPLLALSRLVREHVTVVLSGEGADEDFGGYEIYRHMLKLEKFRKLPPLVRSAAARTFSALGARKLARYARLAQLPLEQRYRGVCLPDMDAVGGVLEAGVRDQAEAAAQGVLGPLYAYTEGAHPLERMMTLDLELWLPDDILVKADKMTMAASLELRVPFLDHEMIEFAASLAPSLKVSSSNGKLVQREAVKDLVPREVLEQPKKGFPTPLAALLRGKLGELATQVLVGRGASGHGLWSERKVVDALAQHRAGKADRSRELWMVLVYELWHRSFVQGQDLGGLDAVEQATPAARPAAAAA
jgi:asparagine synthase (glutamine-hydrolysing)